MPSGVSPGAPASGSTPTAHAYLQRKLIRTRTTEMKSTQPAGMGSVKVRATLSFIACFALGPVDILCVSRHPWESVPTPNLSSSLPWQLTDFLQKASQRCDYIHQVKCSGGQPGGCCANLREASRILKIMCRHCYSTHLPFIITDDRVFVISLPVWVQI